ncbi:uncharacterized protein RCC_12129 [Ramularia collo-cygni]|uniref:Uncharacterized protein n=1 Tax=Ramularia collo-cygni TaxID=112498 RepID=A0A2D3UYT7_9PEZI|nr:uncharacterized protein RCC_12129 [Ramularia collo-cygni]CZT22071.1 uncharacterized protein RCC_12129 [Ramularia collo-cygni]
MVALGNSRITALVTELDDAKQDRGARQQTDTSQLWEKEDQLSKRSMRVTQLEVDIKRYQDDAGHQLATTTKITAEVKAKDERLKQLSEELRSHHDQLEARSSRITQLNDDANAAERTSRREIAMLTAKLDCRNEQVIRLEAQVKSQGDELEARSSRITQLLHQSGSKTEEFLSQDCRG